MLTFPLKEDRVAEYFATARERYEILLKRRAGQKAPWSTDPAFREWRFCNVFREDDKVTQWIRENVREPYHDEPKILWLLTACRLFNKIETLQILKDAGVFDTEHFNAALIRKLLKNIRPIVGAAYVVKTPDDMDKLKGIINMVQAVANESAWLISCINPGDTTLQEMWESLIHFPCIGSFIAYEIVSDLRHTSFFNSAPDISTWAAPGPGACLGLSYLSGTKVSYSNKTHREMAIITMQKLVNISNVEWPKEWPEWEMREAEHWLCEYAKYYKVTHENKRMKRRYQK